jgi:hypothetical protein
MRTDSVSPPSGHNHHIGGAVLLGHTNVQSKDIFGKQSELERSNVASLAEEQVDHDVTEANMLRYPAFPMPNVPSLEVMQEKLKGLESNDPAIRMEAWRWGGSLSFETKLTYADWFWEKLESLCQTRGTFLLEELGLLNTPALQECHHAEQLRLAFHCPIFEVQCPLVCACIRKAMLEDKLSPAAETMLLMFLRKDVRVVRGPTVSKSMSPSSSSLLHLAAKAGNRELCQLLLKSGTLPYLRDKYSATAADVARKHGHLALAEQLEFWNKAANFRGGVGDAFDKAMEDTRFVTKVEWYTIPLSGFFNHILGGKHSLLVVTVVDPIHECNTHSYIIEKACPPVSDTTERYKNGVFISNWGEAAPSVNTRPRHVLSAADLCRSDITMQFLRNLAVDMGDYDSLTRNNHCAARLLYNACAKDEARVRRLPNPQIRFVVRALRCMGQDPDVARRRFEQSAWITRTRRFVLKLGKEKIQDHALHLNHESVEHCNRYASHGVQLSLWAYTMMMQDEEDMIILTSEVTKDYQIIVEETGERISLAAGSVARVKPKACEKRSDDTKRKELTLVIEQPGCLNSVLLHQEVKVGQRYQLVSATNKKELYFEQISGLPQGFLTRIVRHSEGTDLASWSIITSSDTIWVTFRGTESLVDALVDVVLVTFDDADHGLRVQGGMWLALTQRQNHALNAINDKIAELRSEDPSLCNVVFCGHSLGGGYSILAGLDRLYRGLDVTSVLAFGSPQVVVPNRQSPLWHKLNEVTTHYVNSWDIVPRMPSCHEWLFETLPAALPDTLSIRFGHLQIGVNAGRDQMTKHFGKHAPIFADYDIVGTLVFIRKGSRQVVSVPCTEDGHHRKLLSKQPPVVGSFVIEQHSVREYAAIVPRLG